MFCSGCGAENSDGADFCGKCGKPLGNGSKTKKKNIPELVSTAVVALSVFLPYASIWGISKSLIQGADGIVIIVFAIIGVICSLLNKHIGVIVAGGLSLGMFLLEEASIRSGEYGELVSSMLTRGGGYYLLIIGSIAMIITAIIAKKKG